MKVPESDARSVENKVDSTPKQNWVHRQMSLFSLCCLKLRRIHVCVGCVLVISASLFGTGQSPRGAMHVQLAIFNNDNNNSYAALYPVKIYKLNIKIHLTIKKAQVL